MMPCTMRQPQLVALAVALALCLGHLSGTAQGRGALTRNGPDDVVFISNTVPRDVDGNEVRSRVQQHHTCLRHPTTVPVHTPDLRRAPADVCPAARCSQQH